MVFNTRSPRVSVDIHSHSVWISCHGAVSPLEDSTPAREKIPHRGIDVQLRSPTFSGSGFPSCGNWVYRRDPKSLLTLCQQDVLHEHK